MVSREYKSIYPLKIVSNFILYNRHEYKSWSSHLCIWLWTKFTKLSTVLTCWVVCEWHLFFNRKIAKIELGKTNLHFPNFLHTCSDAEDMSIYCFNAKCKIPQTSGNTVEPASAELKNMYASKVCTPFRAENPKYSQF